MAKGGCIVDFHSVDFFPERWFDLVLVLRCNNTVLYDRLKERGYGEKKITENVECEIMEVVAQEAKESYAEAIVHEVQSESLADMESNAERICSWVQAWKVDHPAGVSCAPPAAEGAAAGGSMDS